ncbi:MAG: nucleotidyltransferase domain-containing protein [Candidatus Thorarchaeota archaeon]|jgi:hypothetical protein
MNPIVLKALRRISECLVGREIRWVVAGSTSLALQGVEVEPHDIDILTNRDGAFQIGELLSEFEVEPVSFGQSELFKSYLGRFEMSGVRVEVMGELRACVGDEWISYEERLSSPQFVEFESVRVPVSSLKQQLESYELLGREKDSQRIARIRELLGRNPNDQ